jgi:hypothetical protein
LSEYSGTCIDIRADNSLISACAVNRPAGRRTPGTHTDQRRAAENPILTVQDGAVGERGSGVGRLHAGRYADALRAAP